MYFSQIFTIEDYFFVLFLLYIGTHIKLQQQETCTLSFFFVCYVIERGIDKGYPKLIVYRNCAAVQRHITTIMFLVSLSVKTGQLSHFNSIL